MKVVFLAYFLSVSALAAPEINVVESPLHFCMDASPTKKNGTDNMTGPKSFLTLLGSQVNTVKIMYYSKAFKSFDEAKQKVVTILNGSPGTYDNHIFWAETSGETLILAQLRYANGNSGEMELSKGASTYSCFRDSRGDLVWSRGFKL